MAKVYGIQGNVVGKVANSVYAVVKGVNVVRAYNGSPSNPQTAGQVESRAKLKELSQLAAAFAPLLGYQAKGLVSARNLFIKGNYEKVSYTNDVAEVSLPQLDITGSRVGLGDIYTERTATGVSIQVANTAESVISVVFGCTIVKPNGAIVIKPVQIVTTPDANGRFTTTFGDLGTSETGVVFAWGIRANDAKQFAKYGYLMTQADNVADLMVLIKDQYAGSQTITESLSLAFAAYSE